MGPQASHWLHDLPILEQNLSTYFIIFDSSKGQIVQIQTSHASHVLYQISLWVPTIPLRIECLDLPWRRCIHGQVLSIFKKVLSSDSYFFSILWCSQTSNDQEKLFIQIWLYIRYEIEKGKWSFYILGYLLEVTIIIWWFGIFFPLRMWQIWVNFHKKSLVLVEVLFFRSKFGDNLSFKNHLF